MFAFANQMQKNIVRALNVHEHQSLEIMKEHQVKTPEGYVASTPAEAEEVFRRLNRPAAVIKAQVLSGGRGLGHFKNGFQGGVHVVETPERAKELAEQMLGQELVTKQNKKGILCNKVLLVEKVNVKREMYLSIIMDRASGGPLIVVSPRGGTSIEDVAKSNPEAIYKDNIDVLQGISDEQCATMAQNLGMKPGTPQYDQTITLLQNLYDMFVARDCTQVEINPLVETHEGEIIVCDAKLNFDDRSKYRQPSIFALRDYTQEDPREVQANAFGLRWIGLDGNIGCMVNGAGLAMSTMDLIKHKGGAPANFLDVGGSVTEEQITNAFELLNEVSEIEAVLVNIFGGIVRCDVVARGILRAAEEVGIKKPVVVRLNGTNVEMARELLRDSHRQSIFLVDDLDEAAAQAVEIANRVHQTHHLAHA
jgi:succinyl-CoA synthetase beta subunit